MRDTSLQRGHASYGVMQVYSLYHEVKDDLRENLKKGISYLHSSFQNAIQLDNSRLSCSRFDNSNSASDEIGVLRRTYAGYNGGINSHGSVSQGVCRDDDNRDSNFLEHFFDSPWKEYIPSDLWQF